MTDDGRLWGLFLYLRPVELPCKMGVVFVRKWVNHFSRGIDITTL